MNLKLIISLVKAAETNRVVEAAKVAGGTGATIIQARGTGVHEAKTFFGLTLETQTDVVLFLLEEHLACRQTSVCNAPTGAKDLSPPSN